MGHYERENLELAWTEVAKKLPGYFRRRGCTIQEAEDLAQSTALEAVLSIHNLKNFDRFNAWILGIANNVFKEHCRNRKRERQLVEELGSTLMTSPSENDPDHTYSSKQSEFNLHQMINRLPKLDRMCLILNALHGITFREIGEMLGISLQNAHYHYRKASESLKQAIEEQHVE